MSHVVSDVKYYIQFIFINLQREELKIESSNLLFFFQKIETTIPRYHNSKGSTKLSVTFEIEGKFDWERRQSRELPSKSVESKKEKSDSHVGSVSRMYKIAAQRNVFSHSCETMLDEYLHE